MGQLRSVNTKFWDDPWIEELTVSEKLLFLYLLTNGYANLAGIYEITIKRICFETGIDKGTVSKGLERFAKDKKAYFVNENYIFLPNWLKNQNLNTNMKKGVLKIISELPNDVTHSILGNGYQSIKNDYQKVLNTLLKYEILEDEILEDEILEDEIEKSNGSITVKNDSFDFKKSLYELVNDKQLCDDWLKVRKTKKATNTATAFESIVNEISKSGLSAKECIRISVENSWSGFKSSWLNKLDEERNQNGRLNPSLINKKWEQQRQNQE